MSLESLLVRMLNSARKPPRPPAGLQLGTARSLVGSEQGPFCIPCNPPQHTFLSGRTGSGKTTGLLTIMSKLHQRRIPFLFVDLHGQATDDLLALITGRSV